MKRNAVILLLKRKGITSEVCCLEQHETQGGILKAGILPEQSVRDKKRVRHQSHLCPDAAFRIDHLIIANLMDGQTVVQTVAALQVGRSIVCKVAKRFREHAEAGLVDRREENG